MGQAKIRRANAVPTVYHHTSTLRTNLIWMSGYIQVEGKSERVIHPDIGEVNTSALARRAMTDFPPVAWFTTQVSVPRCLVKMAIVLTDNTTGEITQVRLEEQEAHGFALNRVALGFHIADIPVVHWPKHPGYITIEGQELNETARDAGDNPEDWWVSEDPVDLLNLCEFWNAMNIFNLKMTRRDAYVEDIKRMVTLCRTKEGVYIPPTWLKPEQARRLAQRMNLHLNHLRDVT
jgi:hypothetical protein